MGQQIAFLINPLKKTVAMADYFSWVIETVKVKKSDWEIQLFTKEWPTDLGYFDQTYHSEIHALSHHYLNQLPPSTSRPTGIFPFHKMQINICRYFAPQSFADRQPIVYVSLRSSYLNQPNYKNILIKATTRKVKRLSFQPLYIGRLLKICPTINANDALN